MQEVQKNTAVTTNFGLSSAALSVGLKNPGYSLSSNASIIL
jgi:hypothetical protein